jgi:hypothetical protein
LVHGPSGQTLGAALDSHRIISDVVGRIKKGGGAIRAKNLSTFIDQRWRHAADAGKCAQGLPWPQGSSLPFDINFARRRPHLAPDHFRDPLYDAQMWALRFVRRCGRRVKPHVAQDRQNFGTDGVADPDHVEVAHEHVYRASASALKRDCARPRAADSCGRRISEPPFGLTLILAFAPATSDGARPPLRSSHCHLTADRPVAVIGMTRFST